MRRVVDRIHVLADDLHRDIASLEQVELFGNRDVLIQHPAGASAGRTSASIH
jgi:hypothetical protein